MNLLAKGTFLFVGIGCAFTAAGAEASRTVYTASADTQKSNNFYIGVGLGQAKINLNSALNEDSDLAYSIYGGHQFNRNFSAEISYINLGKSTTTANVTGSSRGVSATAVGAIALTGSASVYGKFGLAKIDSTWDVAPAPGLEPSQSNTGLTWGAGLSFDVSPAFGMRVSFDRYDVGADTPVSGYSQLLSIAAFARF